MTKTRLLLVGGTLIAAFLSQGCDPANTDVYLSNNTSRDIYVSFPLDEIGSHVLVPAHTRALVLKDSFRGAHEAIIEDAQTHNILDKMDCRNSVWKGNTAFITYPP